MCIYSVCVCVCVGVCVCVCGYIINNSTAKLKMYKNTCFWHSLWIKGRILIPTTGKSNQWRQATVEDACFRSTFNRFFLFQYLHKLHIQHKCIALHKGDGDVIMAFVHYRKHVLKIFLKFWNNSFQKPA